MKLFENRAFALLCALLIVCGSTVANVDRHVEKRADKVEALWEAKYGMEEKIEERCSNASQLWSILHKYDALSEDANRLRSAYAALYDTDMDCDEAHRLFTFNEELSAAAESAMTAAKNASLSREDSEWAERYYSNMLNAQRLLESADYHAAQREFSRMLDTAYLRILRPFYDDELPQEFA